MPTTQHPPPPTCETDTEDEEWTNVPSTPLTPDVEPENEEPQQPRYQPAKALNTFVHFGSLFFPCFYLLSEYILVRLYIIFEIPINVLTLITIRYICWEFRLLYKNLIVHYLPVDRPYNERTRGNKDREVLGWFVLFMFWYGWMRLLEDVMECVDDQIWGKRRIWELKISASYPWMLKVGLMYFIESVYESYGLRIGFWSCARIAIWMPWEIGLRLLGMR